MPNSVPVALSGILLDAYNEGAPNSKLVFIVANARHAPTVDGLPIQTSFLRFADANGNLGGTIPGTPDISAGATVYYDIWAYTARGSVLWNRQYQTSGSTFNINTANQMVGAIPVTSGTISNPDTNPGPPGPAGNAAAVYVGSTQTGLPGTQAQVTNIGTSSAANLQFIIPAGAQGQPGVGLPGAAATIAIGTVTSLPTGSAPTVTNVGTSFAAILNFGIPSGSAVVTPPTYTPTSLLLQDSVSGSFYSFAFNNGAFGISPASSGTVSASTLIDTSTSLHYTLTVSSGSWSLLPVASSVTGTASITLADTSNGLYYALTVNNGALQDAQGSGTSSSSTPVSVIPTSLLFLDTVLNTYFQLTVANGLPSIAAASAGTTSSAVLIDTATSAHFKFVFSNGSPSLVPVAGSVAGLSSLTLTDSILGSRFAFISTNGSVAFGPA